MNIEKIKSANINYEAGVQRFMNSAETYHKMLIAFLKDTCLERAEVAFNNCDDEGLLMCVHETKGVSGNMEFTILYKISCELVNLLRSKNYQREELGIMFNAFKQEYADVKAIITEASEC